MNLCRRLRAASLAAGVLLAAGCIAAPAGAAPPPGSANFTPPGYVPDYFSNEASAIRGGGASAGAYARPAAGPTVAEPPRRGGSTLAARRHSRHPARVARRLRGRRHLAHGGPAAHRHPLHARIAERRGASAHRHVATAHRGRGGPTKTAAAARAHAHAQSHARAGPGAGRAVAAKSRHAPLRAKRVASGRG